VTDDFIFHPDGHGWQLDRPAFDALLLKAAERAGAEILWNARVRGIRTERGTTCVLAECQGRSRALAATTFVDASGRACVVARAAGATRHASDRLTGVACLLSGSDGSDAEAIGLIEAVADGWWYSTLLPTGRLAIFFSDADIPALAAARTTGGWLTALRRTRHLRNLVERHRYQPSGNPRVVAANSARLTAFRGPGWLAAGDAAMSYDPLSGRGIFAAMHGARQAAYALAAAVRGEENALEKYGAGLEQDHANYLAALSQNYRAESRWPSADFWRRRHQPPRDIDAAMHARSARRAM
jgi:flavin-dependent dehydrogenase